MSELMIHGRALDTLDLPGDPDRRPLVLLHEGLGSIGLWRAFPQQLNDSTGRRVIAFSRHGHGRSAPPPQPRTRAFFHEEALGVLPEILTRMDAAEPILVGHSDGASIALIHAGHRAVTGLAVMAAHVFVEDIGLTAIGRARRAFTSDGLRERMARHHDDPDAAFHGWSDVWLDPDFADWEIIADAARITAPALVIQGEDDAYGTLAQVDRILAAVRGPATRLVLPGGHDLHLERPQEIVAAITAFAAPLG